MTPEPPSIQVIGPPAGEVVNILGAPVVIKSGVDAQGLFFADHPVPPGYFVPMHVHQDEDELFYVLEGELSLQSPARALTAGPGSYVHLPRGAPHGFGNAGAAPVRMLVVSTAGGLEGVFRGLHAAAHNGPPGPDQVGEICAGNGVRLL